MIHSGTLIHIDVVPNIISPIYKGTILLVAASNTKNVLKII